MAHPVMFDDADPFLGRIRELAHAFPDVDEKVSHGRPAFFTKKVFAYYGGSVRDDGEWVPHDQALIVLADEDDRPAFETDPRCFIPAYLGPYGWVGLDLAADTDWDEVVELLDASYRLTAPKRSIARLDALSGG